jgi:hypothetical protein
MDHCGNSAVSGKSVKRDALGSTRLKMSSATAIASSSPIVRAAADEPTSERGEGLAEVCGRRDVTARELTVEALELAHHQVRPRGLRHVDRLHAFGSRPLGLIGARTRMGETRLLHPEPPSALARPNPQRILDHGDGTLRPQYGPAARASSAATYSVALSSRRPTSSDNVT